MSAVPERVASLEPWSEAKVKDTLQRWWEVRSNTGSPRWALDKVGEIPRRAHEFACTVAYWVTATDRGVRRLCPEVHHPRSPIVELWLVALFELYEARSKATSRQRDALAAGLLRDKHTKADIDHYWRRAEQASRLVHRIEQRKDFGVALGCLAAAFAMCANDDWTWRMLEEVERD